MRRIGFVFSDDAQAYRRAAAFVAADDGTAERDLARRGGSTRIDYLGAADALVVILRIAPVAGGARALCRFLQQRQSARRDVVRAIAHRSCRRTLRPVVVVFDEAAAHGTITIAVSWIRTMPRGSAARRVAANMRPYAA